MRGTWSQDARVSSRQMAWKSGERCEASADLPSINPGHTCDPSASVCNQLHSRCRFSCFFSSSAAEITRGHRQHGCRDETHVTLPVLGMERKSVAAICLTLALPRAAQDAAPSASLPVCLCLCDCLCVCLEKRRNKQSHDLPASRVHASSLFLLVSVSRSLSLSLFPSLTRITHACLLIWKEQERRERQRERERKARAGERICQSGDQAKPLIHSNSHSLILSSLRLLSLSLLLKQQQ